jgi:hypothetical protein
MQSCLLLYFLLTLVQISQINNAAEGDRRRIFHQFYTWVDVYVFQGGSRDQIVFFGSTAVSFPNGVNDQHEFLRK